MMLALSLVACAPRDTPEIPVRTPADPTAPARTERYVAVGASDSVGVGASDPRTRSWPALVARALPAGGAYENTAVSGSLARDAVREQLAEAVAARPTIVTVWLAVNDILAQIPPEQYERDLTAVIEPLLLGTQARIFVGTVPDLRAVPVFEGTDRVALAQIVAAYNNAIVRIASRNVARVIAVDLFTGSAELVSSATVTEDGLHPTDEGYELIAERFVRALRDAGIAVRN